MKLSLTALLSAATLAAAMGGRGNRWFKPSTVEAATSTIKNATFQQLLDHSNPKLGTFSQRYYYDDTYWKGPGSPVVMFAPQEVAASAYTDVLSQSTTSGVLAKQLGAALVLMEHRYWGESSPYKVLSTANMQYQTLDNAIGDANYFAQNVRLPFKQHGSNAADVPWILVGGSYSGALTAWIQAKAPGTFWAYWASSGVVEAISDFWQYFAQIQYGMPQNCSKDTTRVVDYLDNLIATGSKSQIQSVKAQFGLQDLQHNDDFMEALANGPYLWQGNSLAGNTGFFTWCDYVENSVNQTDKSLLPGANGVGLQKALTGYAKWFKTVFLPNYCKNTFGYWKETNSVECFNTYNASSPLFTDLTPANTYNRQWNWFLCNQPFGWWQDGAPTNNITIVSRTVTAQYFIRQCGLFFPTGPQGQTYGIAKGATEAEVNAYTGGWFIDNTTRLLYGNGQFDPWRDATTSSFWRPGGPLKSTPQVPVFLVPSGYHCTDLDVPSGKVNAALGAIQKQQYATLTKWVSEFPKPYPKPYPSHYAA